MENALLIVKHMAIALHIHIIAHPVIGISVGQQAAVCIGITISTGSSAEAQSCIELIAGELEPLIALQHAVRVDVIQLGTCLVIGQCIHVHVSVDIEEAQISNGISGNALFYSG